MLHDIEAAAERTKAHEYSVTQVLERLWMGNYLLPDFQRGFQWKTDRVKRLLFSILKKNPIGSVIIWTVSSSGKEDGEPIWIQSGKGSKATRTYFSASGKADRKIGGLIIDGRQRCTAMTILFSGLRTKLSKERYYINMDESSLEAAIIHQNEVPFVKANWRDDKLLIANGYLPVSPMRVGTEISRHLTDMEKLVEAQDTYESNQIDYDRDVVFRRAKIARQVKENICNAVVSVIEIPGDRTLGDVCDIFEDVNEQQTKITAIDVLAAKLYRDGGIFPGQKVELRYWMANEIPAVYPFAKDWLKNAFLAETFHLCMGVKDRVVFKIRSFDPDRWSNVMKDWKLITGFLSDFQLVIAGQHFTIDQSPSPVQAKIYVGIRYLMYLNGRDDEESVKMFDTVFKAYFWRAVVTLDLEQSGQDNRAQEYFRGLRDLVLGGARGAMYDQTWMKAANDRLQEMMGALNDAAEEDFVAQATKRSPNLDKAVNLFLLQKLGGRDIFGVAADPFQAHHIFPQAAAKRLSSNDLDYHSLVESPSNKMPLSVSKNVEWSDKEPKLALEQMNFTDFEVNAPRIEACAISEAMWQILNSPISSENVALFCNGRARSIYHAMKEYVTIRRSR